MDSSTASGSTVLRYLYHPSLFPTMMLAMCLHNQKGISQRPALPVVSSYLASGGLADRHLWDKRLGFSYCLIFTRHSSRASGSRASKDAVYHQPLEVPIGIKQVRDGRGTGEALPIMYDANMDSDRN
ncbi:hypothetical protein U9M48_042523 [Paspalum notatum var. saurae]|uniref:Uncharacterized protein n=1 Tax=Paspalum notatum var. saurae TaxID=547442 RepID=A0AAQ3URA0_PASNO